MRVHAPDQLDAYLYGLLHRGTAGDVAHYRTVCAGVGRVLELGCGDGRIAVPLAAHGLRVTGLDRDVARLDEARHAASVARVPDAFLRLVQGDMASFDLGERFDRVLIPFNGLYCLDDEAAVHACLERSRAHLVSGGMLWFDVYRVDPEDAPPAGRDPGPPVFLTEIRDGGRTVRVFETDAWDPGNQRIDVEYRFLIRDGDGTSTRSQRIRHRYLTRDQIVTALAATGFGDIRIRSGFDADADGGPWVVSAVR